MHYEINSELNGIEITFDEKPGEITRQHLKDNGFRWHKVKRVWYAKNTAERLLLAQNICVEGGVTAEEGRAKEAATALTVEKMNKIIEGYTFKQTGEGIYCGWTGCNSTWRTSDELKKAILAELKKHGIKATARQGRGGYTTSLTFTVTVPKSLQVTSAEYIEKELPRAACGRYWFYDENGGSIHRDALPMDCDEREKIIAETLRREYEEAIRTGDNAFVNPDFVKLVKTIISSFNSDHSNGQIDYFDRGFYDWYKWKTA